MILTGNTIFVTGGGSGIGRGLAQALHGLGNQVIISGRRSNQLEATTADNPGMRSVELDVCNPASIGAVAERLVAEFPRLNVLINNAGVMMGDDVSGRVDEEVLVATVTTNLLGAIRMTSALIDHLTGQDRAAVINVTSGLAYVPLAGSAIYSSTKAALHSYTLSLRHRLRGTAVTVQEIAPPWVRTGLMGSENEPRAMPLDAFIAGTMEALAGDAEEVLVEQARMFRNNPGPGEHALVTRINDALAGAASR